MKDRLQIYVNYFLIVFKMKKIILLFFTFSGICSCFAQEVANMLPLNTDSVKAKEKSLVRLYPNPALNKVEIEIKGFKPGYVKIQMMSSNGKMVREEKRLVLTGNEKIIFMFSETPGLYYLLLKQGDQNLRKSS